METIQLIASVAIALVFAGYLLFLMLELVKFLFCGSGE